MPRPRLPLWAFVALCGCVEQGLGALREGEGADAGTAAPILVLDPPESQRRGVCGLDRVPVTVRNQGDAVLSIQGATLTGAWTLQGPSWPQRLAPGASLGLVLTGIGAGSLSLDSNDPARATAQMALHAEADTAPRLQLLAPQQNDVLPDADLPLVVRVEDDETPWADLEVAWVDAASGLVASARPDADGQARATWPAGREPGPHVLTAAVTDGCGQSATVDIGLCQQALIDDPVSIFDDWLLSGSASIDEAGGFIELTPDLRNVAGSAFLRDPVVIGGAVSIDLHFFMGEGTGADGIAVTALDLDRAEGTLGSLGSGLGYSAGRDGVDGLSLPGWTVELDSFSNDWRGDPEVDHVALTRSGDAGEHAVWAPIPELEDTGWHDLHISAQGARMVVILDGIRLIDEDLPGLTDFPAWLGFSASTGGQTNRHLVALEAIEGRSCAD